MTDAEEMANKLCGQNIYEIEGVTDIEYPAELNAFIISRYKSSSFGHVQASLPTTLTR